MSVWFLPDQSQMTGFVGQPGVSGPMRMDHGGRALLFSLYCRADPAPWVLGTQVDPMRAGQVFRMEL